MKYKTWLIIKTLLISLSILAIVGIFIFAYGYERKEKEMIAEKNKKLDALTIDLRKERKDLESEVISLKTKIDGDGFGYGTISLLITDPIVSAYYTAAPLIESYGLKGMIAIDHFFFERSGYMNKTMLLDLYNRGFEICVKLDEFDTLDFLMSEIDDLGIICHAAYFSLSTKYKTSYNEKLISCGIDTVIDYAGTSKIHDDGMFEIMAYGSNDTGCKSMLFNAVNGSSPIIYTMGFNDDRERFSESILSSIVKYALQAFDSETITLDNTKTMKEKYTTYYSEWQDSIAPANARILELKVRLNEIEEEIKKIKKDNNL